MKKDYDTRFKQELINMIKDTSFKIISYDYYPKIFGNMVLILESNNSLHKFISDKGDIYYNESLVITHKKCVEESRTTQSALLTKINEVINNN
jgi:hypothetical protein